MTAQQLSRFHIPLLGQGSSLHGEVSSAGPIPCCSHVFPPCSGDGAVHVRDLNKIHNMESTNYLEVLLIIGVWEQNKIYNMNYQSIMERYALTIFF